METPALSLVLPAYNEGEKIKEVVSKIVSAFEKEDVAFELILVNDGSTDNTGEVLKGLSRNDSRIVAISYEKNRGYGGAIREGLQKAKGDVVGWSDSDDQILPEDVVRVYKALHTKNVTAIKALRAIRKESTFRRIQSFIYNLIFTIMFGHRTWDVNAKPKFMKKELLKKITLTDTNYFIDAEWVIKLNRANINFEEVPIEFLKRTSGKSNIRLWTSLVFLKSMMLYALHLK